VHRRVIGEAACALWSREAAAVPGADVREPLAAAALDQRASIRRLRW
jgi:hypothetical protein